MRVKTASVILVASIFAGGCGDTTDYLPMGPSPSGNISTNPVITASGTTVTQVRAVSAFESVAIGVPGRLVIDHAGTSSLTITEDEAVLAVITSDVRDGELVIAQTPNTDLRLDDFLEIEYVVTVAELTRLDVAGTVQAVARGIATASFEVSVNGSSTVAASGRAERQTVFLSGTSRYEAGDLFTGSAEVNISGAAFMLLNARERINGNVSGSSALRYVGEPIVTVNVSGTASVRQQ